MAGITDRERICRRLRTKIKEAHGIERDFVYVTVGTAKMILEMLEKDEIRMEEMEERIGQFAPGRFAQEG